MLSLEFDPVQPSAAENFSEVRALLLRAHALIQTDPDQGGEVAQQALQQAKALNKPELIAAALHCLGNNFFAQGEYWAALEGFLEALGWYQYLSHPVGQAAAFHGVGAAYLQLGDYGHALHYLSIAMQIRQRLDNPKTLADTLNNLAIAYSGLEDAERSLEFHFKALELRRRSGDIQGEGLALNGLGFLYLNQASRVEHQGNTKAAQALRGQALEALQTALELSRQTANRRLEVSALNNLGSVYSALCRHPQALQHFEAALELSRQMRDPALEASLLADMGRSHCALGDPRVGLGFLHDAALLFEGLGSKDEAARVHLDLCTLYEKQGQFEQALAHHKRYHQGRLASQTEAAERTAKALADQLELERARHEAETHKLRYNEVAQQNLELQAKAEHLDRQARQDGLTGIANRRYLDRFLAGKFTQAKVEQCALSLVFADVDHFKRVNDTFSHQVGDKVLQQIAKILEGHCRSADLVARYGGEEFVLVLPNTAASEAWAVCERLRRAVEAYDWGQVAPGLHITLSLGFAEADTVNSVERLVAKADLELYQAKRNGRNQVSPGL